jgi:hypothetical protein
VITGGSGADHFNNGFEHDVFNFTSAQDSTAAKTDVINAFDTTNDTIQFSSSPSFQFKSQIVLQSTQFSGDGNHSEALTSTDGAGNTVVQVDIDADGVADMQIQLVGQASLTNNNFLVI